MSINFDSSKSYNDDYDGNISTGKKTHAHKIGGGNDVLGSDQISKSTATYQEDYLPPPDSPQLGSADPNADKQTPKTAPSPQNLFLMKTHNLIIKLTPQQLSAFPGVTKEEVQAKLIFSFNHPDVPADENVQTLLSQLENQAAQSTQKQLKLSSSWQPAAANTQNADKEISRNANANFENLVRSQLPTDEANKLIFQYYHPEFAEDSDQLTALKNQAYEQTAAEEGLPEGWKIQPDSSSYDASIDSAYDEAFTNHLNSDPETKDLSLQEKAQLETLHQFPDADVPDKAKLQNLLAQLEDEALQDTAEEFNLPEGFQPEACFEDYVSVPLGEFQSKFESAVKNHQPPLSSAQQKLLLRTGGVNAKNLPPELEALFKEISGMTANDVADKYGLPKNWLKSTQEKSLEGDAEVSTNPSAGGTGKTKKKKVGNTGIDAFPAVVSKQLRNRSLHQTQKLAGTAPAFFNRNNQAALNAIQLYQDGTRIFGNWVNNLTGGQGLSQTTDGQGLSQADASLDKRFSLSSDWMMAGDFNFAVTKALDKVRESVYQVQYAEANMSKKTSEMTSDNQQTQVLLNQAEQRNAQEANQPKKNVFAALENIPGPVGVLAKVFEDTVKTLFWCVDTILGGALSAICQACGCQPLSENPLELMGVLTADQAAKMDQVVQGIVMAVEIVVEILLAQPELVMASIAAITEDAATVAAEIAIKTVVKEVVENVGEKIATMGIKQLTKQAGEALGEEAIEAIASQVSSKAGKALSKTAQEQLEKAIVKALTKNSEKIVKTAVKEARTMAEDFGEDALEELSEQASVNLERVGGKADMLEQAGKGKSFLKVLKSKGYKIRDAVVNIGPKLRQSARNVVKGMLKMSERVGDQLGENRLSSLVDYIGESTYNEAEVARIVGRSARNAKMAISGVTKVSRAYRAASFISDSANASLQIASGVINGVNNLTQARLKIEMGELEAALENLDADLQIMKQLQRVLLDSLSQLAGWINDINQQEGDFFKKSQIHFIAA
jgi:hypothetical protein